MSSLLLRSSLQSGTEMDETEFASNRDLSPMPAGYAASESELRAFNHSLLAILWTLPLDSGTDRVFVRVSPYKNTEAEAWRIYVSAGARSLGRGHRDDWESNKIDIDRSPGSAAGRFATLIDTAWHRGITNLAADCNPAKNLLTAHDLLRYEAEAAKWDPK